MILDRLSNADIYRCLGKRFAAAFDYLRTDLSSVSDGRHEIQGDEIYAIAQSYQSKPIEKGLWEAHRRYADVQYVISGRERMGIVPIDQMRVQTPYKADTDAELFAGDGQFVIVEAGSFTIFLPQDVHMPGIAVEKPTQVKKVVVKVRLGE